MISLNTGCVDEKKWIPRARNVTKSGVTVFWVTPSFGYPRITSRDTQNTKSELNKSLHGASNMASGHTSENCHPKKFLAVEIVVGEDKCTTVVKLLGKSDQQQFRVGCFTCKQCSRSIWDTHERRIFSLVGIPCFRKWPNLVLFD